MDRFTSFCRNHKWTLILTSIGAAVVVLILTINFWRTLLIAVVVSLCIFIGGLLDKSGKKGVKEFFNNIFKNN